MVALHARRSFAAIDRFRRLYPELPLIVALTGTDLYGDIRTSVEAQQSLELATRLIIRSPRGPTSCRPTCTRKSALSTNPYQPLRDSHPGPKRLLMSVSWGTCARSKTPFALPWQPAFCRPSRACVSCM
jgi:hypothetical protein